MICSRCKSKMTEQKRSFHKRRKWICDKCGMVKMQEVRLKSRVNHPKG